LEIRAIGLEDLMAANREGALRDLWRTAGLSVLLAAAPLGAFAAGAVPVADGCADGVKSIAKASDAPPTEGTSVKSSAIHAKSPTALHLTPSQINQLLSPLPRQVLAKDLGTVDSVVVNELPAGEALPELVVEASNASQLPSASTDPPCGLTGMAWSLAHPFDAWREVAPLTAASHTDTCLRSEVVVDHVPEALASVRWFQ
jgi:hypothetical protein